MKVQKSQRKLLVVLVIVVVLGALGLAGLKAVRSSAMANPQSIPVGKVDITQVPDGVYTGEAKNGIVRAKVSVAVEGGAITKIDILKHVTGKGKSAEAITGDVIRAGSLEVDAISSATLSSKTLLQAIENALTLRD